MKQFANLLLLTIFSILAACTPQSVAEPEEEPEEICETTTTATVHYMQTTTSGDEDFYYLVLTDPGTGQEMEVFPTSLSADLQVEGLEIEINYSISPKVYEYIICLEGHVLDPDNPHTYKMPIADVCSTSLSS